MILAVALLKPQTERTCMTPISQEPQRPVPSDPFLLEEDLFSNASKRLPASGQVRRDSTRWSVAPRNLLALDGLPYV